MPPVELPDSIYHSFADIERRLGELERGGRLGNTGLSEGALIVTDASGNERVRIGVLDESNPKRYGLRMSSGFTIIDNDIAGATYQPQNADMPSTGTRSSSAYGDLLLGGVGPAVTFTVSSTGNVLVVVGCQISLYQDSVDAGYMGYDVTGANVQAPMDNRSCNMGLNVVATTGVSAKVAETHLYTNWNEGVTTITAKYRGGDYSAIAFSNRFVFAIPL